MQFWEGRSAPEQARSRLGAAPPGNLAEAATAEI